MPRKIPTILAIGIILILAAAVGAGVWWYGEKNKLDNVDNNFQCNYNNPPKEYKYRDIDSCTKAFIVCEEGEKNFSDECGCGCETIDAVDTSDWQTYRNEKFGFEVKYPFSYTLEQPVEDVLIIHIPQKQEYMQIQTLNTMPNSPQNYKPFGAQFIGKSIVGEEEAFKYYTENPLDYGGVLQDYPYTEYNIILGYSRWININYYGSDDIADSFEKILSSFRFIE